MMTQCERVLAHLQSGKRLTQFEAMTELGIMRLASRITDLRQQGHDIKKEMIDVSNRWGETCKVAAYTLHDRKDRIAA